MNNRTSGTSAEGGGASVYHSGAGSIWISDNSFLNNRTSGTGAEGGGASVYHSGAGSIGIRDNSFVNNRTSGNGVEGGGAYIAHGGAGATQIINNRFTDNSTGGTSASGGGLYTIRGGSGDTTIRENVFANNAIEGTSADGGGAAIRQMGSGSTVVINNSATGNTIEGTVAAGIGLHAVANNGTVYVQSNTVTNNLSPGPRNGFGGIGSSTAANGTVWIEQNTISANFGGVSATGAGLTYVNDNRVTDNFSTGVSLSSSRLGGGTFFAARNVITENQAESAGAGMTLGAQDGAKIVVVDTIITGNTSYRVGGGMYAFLRTGGSIEIVRTTINNNLAKRIQNPNAGYGGGIYVRNEGGAFLAEQVTISSNDATVDGGGMWIDNPVDDRVLIRHATITQNTADSDADGIGDGAGVFVSRGSVEINHTIVAGNHVPDGVADDIATSTVTAHYSLIGTNANTALAEAPVNSPDANGNLVGGPVHGVIDPLLGPLADNGGPTLTHALLAGSPAINRGDLNAMAGVDGVPRYDQRGEPFHRIAGGRLDIGAFEYQQPSDLNLLVDTLVDELDTNYSRGDLSLREAIHLANTWPSTDTIRFDPALAGGTILLKMGELKITDDVAIIGLGADQLAIDAQQLSRIFNIDDGGIANDFDVSIARLTLTRGRTTGANGFSSNAFSGGAIRSVSLGTLIIDQSIVSHNATEGWRSGGGGIFATGELIVSRSEISDNRTSGQQANGSGIDGANILIEESTIIRNQATGFLAFGGGVFSDGNVTLIDAVVCENSVPAGPGGGIAAGSVLLNDSTVENNSAIGSGGIFGFGSVTANHSLISGNSSLSSAWGGGIYSPGNVTLNHTAISGNRAESGAGVSSRSTVMLNQSTVSGIIAEVNGGGIDAMYVTLSRSTVNANNAGGDGGGIRAYVITITESTIFGNSAGMSGGGIHVGWGGMIEQSTISGNSAGSLGGGIRTLSGVSISHSTVTANSALEAGGGIFGQSVTTLNHAIVAANTAPSGADLTGLIGTRFNARYSLIGSNANSGLDPAPVNSPDVNGNLIGGNSFNTRINPQLDPLANNGGPTLTHALLPGSPAINAGDRDAMAGVNGVPSTDQRGEPFTRVDGGRIDMGAFELQQPQPLPGDFNRDGRVDTADFIVWRKQAGTAVAPGTGADANGDGLVDDADRAVWVSHLGQTRATQQANAAAAIEASPGPEPRAPLASSSVAQAPQPRVATLMAGRSARRMQFSASGPEQSDRALTAWIASLPTSDLSSFHSTSSRFAPFDGAGAADESETEVASALDRVFETLGAAM